MLLLQADELQGISRVGGWQEASVLTTGYFRPPTGAI